MSAHSWGNYPLPTDQREIPVSWRDTISSHLVKTDRLLPRGLGRSYGDSCLLSRGALLDMTGVNRVLAFDRQAGWIRVEAGMSIADLLEFIVPLGWFVPVTPGTKFVTIGGAIANDIHGKNHHEAGTFGCHVRAFELVRSDGTVRLCSSTSEPEFFGATIGGLGLTGCITWAEIQLIPISSASMRAVYAPFSGMKEFLELSDRSTSPYTVAWIDTSSQRMDGIFMEGWHATKGSSDFASKTLATVPMMAPEWLLSSFTVRLFNRIYGALQRALPRVRPQTSLNAFFYPLDAIGKWNRFYGKRGFVQYQFAIPEVEAAVIDQVLGRLRQGGHLSFLTVLKKFGARTSPGWLSFPQAGLTLALDLPCAPTLFPLLVELDQLILNAGGRIYPAKDARMSAETFRAMYPRWKELEALRDPHITSNFWERVTR